MNGLLELWFSIKIFWCFLFGWLVEEEGFKVEEYGEDLSMAQTGQDG